jgi:hypothetical protein
MFGSSND